MALSTPLYLQTREYSALSDRIAFEAGSTVRAGVYSSADLAVSQRAVPSPNMSVDVSAGAAAIPANNSGNSGLYYTRNDAVMNVAVAASHASLPRIDTVVLTARDSTHGGDASDGMELRVFSGTPTSGATLDNRTGAASLPSNSLLLADVLVGAGVTSVTNANIRSRRILALGYRNSIYLPAVVRTSSGTLSVISSLDSVIEASGRPVEITFTGSIAVSAATADASFGASVDGSVPAGVWTTRSWIAGAANTISFTQVIFPGSGRRTLGIMWSVGGGLTATLNSANFTVTEMLQ